MGEEFPMRTPCRACGGISGEVRTRNGQDYVFCLTCGRWCYNAPRVETGRAVRTVQSIREAISPKQRARVLVRAGGHCELCG